MTTLEIKKLDELWSEVVKLKANNKCEICKKDGQYARLNACHIIGRRHRATRWGAWFKVNDIRFYDLCGFSGCFLHHNQYDEHGPEEKMIREQVIGQDRYDRVREHATLNMASSQYFEEIHKDLLEVKRECEINNKKAFPTKSILK